MKEKIETAKSFICYYIALPLFVLMVLSTGVGAMGKSTPSDKGLHGVINGIIYNNEEKGNTTPSIEGEISSDSALPIIAKDLSKEFDVLNSTDEKIDEESLLSMPLLYPYKEGVPIVLVVHSHGTESYADESESFSTSDEKGHYGFYSSESETRSTDTEKNMIAIGEAFCSVLSENGINAIQCRIMHDEDDYNSAYESSRKSIKEYLEKHPSIKYIIDIHRDSLSSEDGSKTKTLATEIEGTAQVMLVNGTNFENWEDNLSLALKYKKAMDKKYPSLSRPIYLRKSKYNLDMTRASLLLEVGTCANTFKEAKNAAVLAAECLAYVIKQEN